MFADLNKNKKPLNGGSGVQSVPSNENAIDNIGMFLNSDGNIFNPVSNESNQHLSGVRPLEDGMREYNIPGEEYYEPEDPNRVEEMPKLENLFFKNPDNLKNKPFGFAEEEEGENIINNRSVKNENLLENIIGSDSNQNKNLLEEGSENGDEGSEDESENLVAEAIKARKARENKLDDEEEEDEDSESPSVIMNRGFLDVPHGYEKKKSGKKSAKKAKKKGGKAKEAKKEDDIAHTDVDMSPVGGMNFAVRNLPAVNRGNRSGIRRFFSKIAGFLLNVVASPIELIRRFKRRSLRRTNEEQAQARDRNLIPGWNDAAFENTVKNENELDIDFRQVPAVWSYLTAEEPLDQDGDPRIPQLSVYVQEPDQNAGQNGGEGHTGIGIEFSRYSLTTGRWERYNLRYGFHMAGNFSDEVGQAALRKLQATVPGRLQDESGEPYSVSRSYPATAKQVNNVLKASQSYADHGYNVYTRNNTSFARSMLLDIAHVPGAQEIFERAEQQNSLSDQTKALTSTIAGPPDEPGMEMHLNRLINEDDLDYANYGNKRMTADEYGKYNSSVSSLKLLPSETDSAGAVGENIRRLQGKDVGILGSYKMTNDNGDGSVNLYGSRHWLRVEGQMLKFKLEKIEPTDELKDQMPEEFSKILDSLEDLGKPIEVFTLEGHSAARRSVDSFSRDELQEMRSGLSKNVVNLNKLLFKYYKNDRRVHPRVMRLLSLLNEAMTELDAAYNRAAQRFEFDPPDLADAKSAEKTGLADSDLGNLRNQMNKREYKISFMGMNMRMTPSMYEAYLQIYKSPKKVIAAYTHFSSLAMSVSRGVELQGEDKKDFEKHMRILKLAGDFDKSHRYMLEKDSYSQQDVDYAFNLEKKEKEAGFTSEMDEQNTYASQIYQSLFLEKVFEGMGERFKEYAADAPDDFEMRDCAEWIIKDVTDCIDENESEMKKIMKGIAKTMTLPSEADLAGKARHLIYKNWICRLFDTHREKELAEFFRNSWYHMSDHGTRIRKKLEPIAKQALDELYAENNA